MQALSRFRTATGPRRASLALLGLLAARRPRLRSRAPPPAAATVAPAPKPCPGFRVLHDDRIGAAVFPAGTYTMNLEDTSLTCKSSAELFARFLEDYDGVLPTPVEGRRTKAPARPRSPAARSAGFSVELTSEGERRRRQTNPNLGKLCPGTFSVNSTTVVGSLRFTKGAFLIYLPSGSAITCASASALFTRFLGAGGHAALAVEADQPDGDLLQAGRPGPHRLPDRTAERLRPPLAQPRSAFAISLAIRGFLPSANRFRRIGQVRGVSANRPTARRSPPRSPNRVRSA